MTGGPLSAAGSAMRHLALLLCAALACTPGAPPSPAPKQAPPAEPDTRVAGDDPRPERPGSIIGGGGGLGRPREPEYHYASGEGGVGGVVGAQPAPPAPSIEDVPVLPSAGFKKPALADRGCIGRSIRISADLLDHVNGPITVKFAVLRDGKPARFEVLSTISDRRVADAIWQGIKDCEWMPGADPLGRPANVWVIMPVRLQRAPGGRRPRHGRPRLSRCWP